MIPETEILFSVQHLQKCRRGISFIVTADLVYLIQQHQRVGNSRLAQSLNQPPRHGSHIGLTVPADLCLIPYAAQADTHIFFVERTRYRPGH